MSLCSVAAAALAEVVVLIDNYNECGTVSSTISANILQNFNSNAMKEKQL